MQVIFCLKVVLKLHMRVLVAFLVFGGIVCLDLRLNTMRLMKFFGNKNRFQYILTVRHLLKQMSVTLKRSIFTTSKTDRQLLRQKVH